jgi:hypothetical protein
VRRILLLLTATMLVAVMLAVTAGPALAAPGGQRDEADPRAGGTTPSNSFHAIGETAPPVIPPGVFQRPESVEPHAPMPFTGPPPHTYD